MTSNVYSFTRLGSVEDEHAVTRQDIVRSLHEALNGAVAGINNIPIFVREAFEAKVWQQTRVFSGGTRQSPISFHDFVHQAYPVGLGSTYETVRRFLVVDAATLAMWDEACQRGAGNANRDPETGRLAPSVDNVHERAAPDRPTGNSAQAGIRRLRKAADEGQERAAALLARVEAKDLSVNAAAVEMGWRHPTLTVRDDLSALVDAAMRKGGLLGVARLLLARVTPDEREAILLMVAAWSPPAAGASEGLV